MAIFRSPKIALFTLILINVLVVAFFYVKQASSFKKLQTIDYIGIEIDGISYSGNDDYRVAISLMNNWVKNILIMDFERRFYVQTDRGWNLLSDTPVNDSFGIIGSMNKKKIITTVKIPLNIPYLYRTYEGDISLLFRCKLQFIADRGKTVFSKSSEEYYWISPNTDRWLHREGM